MSADSPNVTAGGLGHIGSNRRLRTLKLGGLGAYINDALLRKLHHHNNLAVLALGSPECLLKAKLTATAVIGSVRGWRYSHSHRQLVAGQIWPFCSSHALIFRGGILQNISRCRKGRHLLRIKKSTFLGDAQHKKHYSVSKYLLPTLKVAFHADFM